MEKAKTYAAIDIGSNAARLLIKRIDQNAAKRSGFKKLLLLRVPLRLGFDVFKAGKLSKKKMEQVVRLLKAYRQLMKIYGVETYRACATSAMRDAKNGKEVMQEVKKETGMYVATEVATAKHVYECLKAGVDILWIGARTTANPFAVQEVADALKGVDIPVLVKNPVNPDLELWIGAMERINGAGIKRLAAIHRGFSSYDKSIYRNLPQWHIPIELRRRIPALPIICDPSHIGGKRELIAPLSQQAMDLGFGGLIVESHCKPDCAWSDKAQQVTPDALAYIIRNLVIRDQTITTESLTELRSQIDKLDDELLELLTRRMRVSRDIGQYKKEHNMPVLQAQRYDELLARRAGQAEQMGMDREFMRTVLQAIHEESIRQQMEVLGRA